MTNQEKLLAEAKWLAFFRQHPTFNNQANRQLLQEYLDNNMLSVASEDGAESLEIAFLACHSRLGERIPEPVEAKREPAQPKPNAPRPPAFNDPKWTVASLKEHLRNTDSMARADNRKTQPLPPEYTRERILSKEFSGEEMRKLVSDPRFGGMAAVQRRLDGKE
jgi:hypothetical protein